MFWPAPILGSAVNIVQHLDSSNRQADRTRITVSFVITKDNVGEMVPFVYLAKSLDVDSIQYWTLHEYDGLDWRVETKDGQVFDYRKATTSNFAEEFRRQIEQTRRAAEIVGIDAQLPGIDVLSKG